MGEYKDNNIVTVAGIVEDMPVFNHEVYKEKFYIFTALCQTSERGGRPYQGDIVGASFWK